MNNNVAVYPIVVELLQPPTLEKEGQNEYQQMIITRSQNSKDNGYGAKGDKAKEAEKGKTGEKGKDEIPAPVEDVVHVRDESSGAKMNMAFTYYPSNLGKTAVTVLLLHGFDGSRAEYEGLASALQRLGDSRFLCCLERVVPRYETLPGWRRPITGARRLADLPPEARAYLDRLQDLSGAPIRYVSVGTRRDQIIEV